MSDADLNALIACPSCDALYLAMEPASGERATCARCHHVLIAPITGAILRVVALALTVLILLVAALFFPFLTVEAAGLSNSSSIIEAALSFSRAQMILPSLLVLGFIIVIPLARAVLLLYVLVPLLLRRRPLPGARGAFRWSEEVRPWSMAEIFVLGVGVALVKVADMARVELGAAFWLFAGLVLVTIFQDGFLCRWSIWEALERGHAVRPDPVADAETGHA